MVYSKTYVLLNSKPLAKSPILIGFLLRNKYKQPITTNIMARRRKPSHRKAKQFKLKPQTEQVLIISVVIAIIAIAAIFILQPAGIVAQFGAAAKVPLKTFIFNNNILVEEQTVDLYNADGVAEHTNVKAISVKDITGQQSFEANGKRTSNIYIVRSSATGGQLYYLDVDGKIKHCCSVFF